MARITLWLSSQEEPALERTSFHHPLLQVEQRAVRGKTNGAYHGYASFQWSPAVQSLVALVLRTAALPVSETQTAAVLEGSGPCPATTLDYALGKVPNWLLDVFGADKSGTPICRRLFKRSNPEQKRPGPVAVSLNEHALSRQDITILVAGKPLTDPVQLSAIADKIEARLAGKEIEISRKKAEIVPIPDSRTAPANSAYCPCCGKWIPIELIAKAV